VTQTRQLRRTCDRSTKTREWGKGSECGGMNSRRQGQVYDPPMSQDTSKNTFAEVVRPLHMPCATRVRYTASTTKRRRC